MLLNKLKNFILIINTNHLHYAWLFKNQIKFLWSIFLIKNPLTNFLKIQIKNQIKLNEETKNIFKFNNNFFLKNKFFKKIKFINFLYLLKIFNKKKFKIKKTPIKFFLHNFFITNFSHSLRNYRFAIIEKKIRSDFWNFKKNITFFTKTLKFTVKKIKKNINKINIQNFIENNILTKKLYYKNYKYFKNTNLNYFSYVYQLNFFKFNKKLKNLVIEFNGRRPYTFLNNKIKIRKNFYNPWFFIIYKKFVKQWKHFKSKFLNFKNIWLKFNQNTNLLIQQNNSFNLKLNMKHVINKNYFLTNNIYFNHWFFFKNFKFNLFFFSTQNYKMNLYYLKLQQSIKLKSILNYSNLFFKLKNKQFSIIFFNYQFLKNKSNLLLKKTTLIRQNIKLKQKMICKFYKNNINQKIFLMYNFLFFNFITLNHFYKSARSQFILNLNTKLSYGNKKKLNFHLICENLLKTTFYANAYSLETFLKIKKFLKLQKNMRIVRLNYIYWNFLTKSYVNTSHTIKTLLKINKNKKKLNIFKRVFRNIFKNIFKKKKNEKNIILPNYKINSFSIINEKYLNQQQNLKISNYKNFLKLKNNFNFFKKNFSLNNGFFIDNQFLINNNFGINNQFLINNFINFKFNFKKQFNIKTKIKNLSILNSNEQIFFQTIHQTNFLSIITGFVFLSKKLMINSNINQIKKSMTSFYDKYDIQRHIIKFFFKSTLIGKIFNKKKLHQKLKIKIKPYLDLLTLDYSNNKLFMTNNSLNESTDVLKNFFILKTFLINFNNNKNNNFIMKSKKWKLFLFKYYSKKKKPFNMKRIRFKPGYIRIWKEARALLQKMLNLKFRYQHRLTTYIGRKKNLILFKRALIHELTLFNIIKQSRILTNTVFILNFINNEIIYINGMVCINPNFQLHVADFIQFTVNLQYYIIYKFILNFNFKLKLRERLKIKKKLERFHSDMEKQKSKRFLESKQFESHFNHDVSKFLEIDFFTLSIYIIYEPFLLNEFNVTNLFTIKHNILNMYNWKYIN